MCTFHGKILLGAVAFATASAYPFNYSNTHGPHMVLQRGVNATLWGFGSTFQAIYITLANPATNTSWEIPGVVASDGTWHVKLPSQSAGGPYNISGQQPGTGEAWNMTDVLFGDVVLCGGQSNMALGMGSSEEMELNNSSLGSRHLHFLRPQTLARLQSTIQRNLLHSPPGALVFVSSHRNTRRKILAKPSGSPSTPSTGLPRPQLTDRSLLVFPPFAILPLQRYGINVRNRVRL